MTVAVLIVNWNGGALLARCLQSIASQRRPPDRVIIVDNASTDDSLRLAEGILRNAEVIRLRENVGFARANNIAAESARDADALVLLNPDAFAEPAWLDALIIRSRADPLPPRPSPARCGSTRLPTAWTAPATAITSPVVPGATATDNPPPLRRRVRSKYSRRVPQPHCTGGPRSTRSADSTSGSSATSRTWISGFRLRLRGHRCVYVPGAVVRHVSSALSGYRSDFAVYHGERNAVWTFVKNMPAPLLWLYLPQHLLFNVAAPPLYPVARTGAGRVASQA